LFIAQEALDLGVRRVLLLDLARVGMNEGTGTDALAKALIVAHTHVEVSVGGGVRDAADLRRLKAIGVRSVLVASAVHDGRIQRSDLSSLYLVPKPRWHSHQPRRHSHVADCPTFSSTSTRSTCGSYWWCFRKSSKSRIAR